MVWRANRTRQFVTYCIIFTNCFDSEFDSFRSNFSSNSYFNKNEINPVFIHHDSRNYINRSFQHHHAESPRWILSCSFNSLWNGVNVSLRTSTTNAHTKISEYNVTHNGDLQKSNIRWQTYMYSKNITGIMYVRHSLTTAPCYVIHASTFIVSSANLTEVWRSMVWTCVERGMFNRLWTCQSAQLC